MINKDLQRKSHVWLHMRIFYNWITQWVDEGRAEDIGYLIKWKAFGPVSCKIVKCKLLKYGLDKHGDGLKTVEHLSPKHCDQWHKVWLEASSRQCISRIHTASSPLLNNYLGEMLKNFTVYSTKQSFGLWRGKRVNLGPPDNTRCGNAGQRKLMWLS